MHTPKEVLEYLDTYEGEKQVEMEEATWSCLSSSYQASV